MEPVRLELRLDPRLRLRPIAMEATSRKAFELGAFLVDERPVIEIPKSVVLEVFTPLFNAVSWPAWPPGAQLRLDVQNLGLLYGEIQIAFLCEVEEELG